MADQGANSLIYTLGVTKGIKRDGTTFESREFSDGLWTRFQRGVPKKIGGYRSLFSTPDGIPRGIITNAANGITYMFVGNQFGMDVFTLGTNQSTGVGPVEADMLTGIFGQAVVSNTTGSFVVATDLTGVYTAGVKVVFSQTPGSPTYTVTSSTYSSPNTTVNISTSIPGSPTDVWLYGLGDFDSGNPHNLWQFDMAYDPLGENMKVLAHPGQNLHEIDAGVKVPVYIGDMLSNSSQGWSFEPLADTEGQNPTYQTIAVDGGVCMLYPFIFVYGSGGYIANNHVDTTYGLRSFNNWNGATANQTNVAAGKIVKGMPVRGGTNSPSGLFWATDSLIRVSFTGIDGLYWKYDILSSQTSIMSSSAVVEMDGTFFWMGVDRFYQYNGNVSVLPNDKNVNWLFDNLNYNQRQKVWASKIPRFNEIWFFYPRGTATECNDAIIYNVKDQCWYDAGSAIGSRRSCGYTTEVYQYPIWCGWENNHIFSEPFTVITHPTGTTAPTTSQFYLEGDLTPTFYPGTTVAFALADIPEEGYRVTNSEFFIGSGVAAPGATRITLSKVPPAGAIAPDAIVYQELGGYDIWQHEFGKNSITILGEAAIPASITTCDISWIGGDPSQDTPQGLNRRMHLRRIEPDFVQVGDMDLNILGRPFARGPVSTSGPFTFGPDTGKIDLRVEDREIRLQFSSNTINGDFEMGRIMITAEPGDERP